MKKKDGLNSEACQLHDCAGLCAYTKAQAAGNFSTDNPTIFKPFKVAQSNDQQVNKTQKYSCQPCRNVDKSLIKRAG